MAWRPSRPYWLWFGGPTPTDQGLPVVHTLACFNNKRSTSAFCMPHALLSAETRHHTLHWWAKHAVATCIKDAPCYHLTFAFYSYPLPSEYCSAYRSPIPQFSSHSSRRTTSKELTRICWVRFGEVQIAPVLSSSKCVTRLRTTTYSFGG